MKCKYSKIKSTESYKKQKKKSNYKMKKKNIIKTNKSGRGGGGGVILPPSWFSLNNPKTVKAVTLEFCNIR